VKHRLPLVLSLIALLASLLALTQRGIAQALLPPRSVGTAQLKNGAVTAAKVRKHTLLRSNFKPGQLPAGPQGSPGPSEAYWAAAAGPVAVPVQASPATLTELEIPESGSYWIVAKAYFESTGSGIATLTCTLDTFEGDTDEVQLLAGNATPAVLTLVHAYAAAGSVGLRCAGRAPASARSIKVVALRVGTALDTGLSP
jgi:hypothetical protein